VYAIASGATSYASTATSSGYRAAYVESDSNSTGYASLYVDPGHTGKAAVLNGDADVNGVLTVSSCVGCFGPSEIMQNAGDTPIQAGDVVRVIGTGAPVVGSAPVLMVRKSDSAYDQGVVGVAGQALYVPSAQTRAAYEQQEAAIRDAMNRRNEIMSGHGSDQEKAAQMAAVTMPQSHIDDNVGRVHLDTQAANIASNSYGTLATQGTMPAVKVTAVNGAIQAGDLLVSSGTPGVAMKADTSKLVPGTVIGKALGDLANGTGTVPVLVTLK
jgi:hypothetical protein